jgi:hypothetical protein
LVWAPLILLLFDPFKLVRGVVCTEQTHAHGHGRAHTHAQHACTRMHATRQGLIFCCLATLVSAPLLPPPGSPSPLPLAPPPGQDISDEMRQARGSRLGDGGPGGGDVPCSTGACLRAPPAGQWKHKPLVKSHQATKLGFGVNPKP